MLKRLPVVQVIEQDRETVDVGAAGGAGQAFAESRPTSKVQLINLSGLTEIQYQVGAGPWLTLQTTDTIDLVIDLSTTTIQVRSAGRLGLAARAQIFFDLALTPAGASTDPWYASPDATPLIISEDNPVDADGRPDGTIWLVV